MSKSLIELAHEFVAKEKGPVNFSKIWDYVKKEAGLSEEDANKRVGQFFTNMMLDGRFVTLGENEWDLRERHTFDKVHIDMRDVYKDVQTSYDDDSEESQEEEEYNKVFEDDAEESDEFNESEDGEEESSKEEEEF